MTTEKESRLHCFTKTPLKLPLLDRYYPLLNPPNETMRSQYFVSVSHHGSDSYSLTNNNSARVYDLQNGQPGPLPALIHGALGSPCTYRRGNCFKLCMIYSQLLYFLCFPVIVTKQTVTESTRQTMLDKGK